MASDKCLHRFSQPVDKTWTGERMNNPFECKSDGVLSVALKELECIRNATWGKQKQKGKTFGVLVVKDDEGKPGFLCAYSGLMDGMASKEGWVPPIYDITEENGYFKKEEGEITKINRLIKSGTLTEKEKEEARKERKERSEKLQDWIFNHYEILNRKREKKNIIEIFREYSKRKAPGGTGDCCAPKLLQYAYTNGLTPVAIAETDEYGELKPACERKCRPLLTYMLGYEKGEEMPQKNVSHVEEHPWGLFLPGNAKILMLGSFPPLKKRWSIVFYYPNINNDMWRIMGEIYYGNKEEFVVKGEKKFDKEKIIAFLKREGIALGDVATKVIRENGDSSDLYLKVVETIDIKKTLEKAPSLETIVVTGEKASEALCEKLRVEAPKVGEYVEAEVEGRKLKVWRMVSSSRAYPLAFDKKVEIYRKVYSKY